MPKISNARKNTVYQIEIFRPCDKTRRAATVAGRKKTAIIAKKETAAALRILAIVEEKTAAFIETAATMGIVAVIETIVAKTRAPKIFKKGAIIATKKEITTVAASTSRKNSAARFSRGKKYIFRLKIILQFLLKEEKKWYELELEEGELLLSCRRQMKRALYKEQNGGSRKSSYIGEITWRNYCFLDRISVNVILPFKKLSNLPSIKLK